jgi:hypothetical protein
MHGKSVYTIVPASPQVRAVQDEWGMFDPNQAGLKAAFRAVRALSPAAIDDAAPEPGDRDDALEPILPADLFQEPARECEPEAPVFDGAFAAPARVSEADAKVRGSAPVRRSPEPARRLPRAAADDENVYDLTDEEPAQRRHKPADRGAVYTLEFPTRCPQCCTEINSVRVSRLLRTQVSFTSTLPRKGYIIVCPECDGILSAELSGLL